MVEVKDPNGSEQTDTTDAEPGEEPRLPRCFHAAARRSSAQNMPPPPLSVTAPILTVRLLPSGSALWSFSCSGLWLRP